MYSKILYKPHSAWASGLRAEGKCHRGSEALFSEVKIAFIIAQKEIM